MLWVHQTLEHWMNKQKSTLQEGEGQPMGEPILQMCSMRLMFRAHFYIIYILLITDIKQCTKIDSSDVVERRKGN